MAYQSFYQSVMVPALNSNTTRQVNLVPCNSTAYCQDGNTCCKLPSGEWGCCPYENAVCCSNHLHCCPESTTCDVSQGKCLSKDQNTELVLRKITVPVQKVNLVQCNSTAYCQDGHTCCKLLSGQWGCCPYENAVCCSDGSHCCPEFDTCDVSQGKCLSKDQNTELVLRKITVPVEKVNLVQCNSTAYCQDGNTCCKLLSGQWGCCPFENAVCCSDGIHCCESGYVCKQGLCYKDSNVRPMLKKVPALNSNTTRQVNSVICDAGSAECPDGSTCCKLLSGEWGCCPYENAVCCSDHLHCCPESTTCDVSKGKCLSKDQNTELVLRKITFALQKSSQIKCVDSHCSSYETCCQLSKNEWSCCPITNAVCCPRSRTCCPEGYRCNHRTLSCSPVKGSVFITKNIPAVLTVSKVNEVECPGGEYSCKDGETCCSLGNEKGWGCCPLKDAVCCSDHEHCCPKGLMCHGSKCIKSPGVMQLFKKQHAIKAKKPLQI
ncbi:progranulin-like [Xenia sp. Carnegie-2017]|uniref:progranulin-like n=1 Tax=Xenia sp. Carnegie-2017 TaxID=2897299 RepID=UPI001F03963A|nr:progranulin-like [Xenia sp. Carnegie-2017]